MPQLTILFAVFCVVVTIAYWLIPSRWQTAFLAASSTIFLAFLDLVSFGLLVLLVTAVFLLARNRVFHRVYSFCLIGMFILFCAVRIGQLIQRQDDATHWLVLIGFGFYLLRLVHYWIDQRASVFRPHSFLDFYSYMLFFPTITIGPIHRFDDFMKSERRVRWDEHMFAAGLERILYGYVKVMVIANWAIALQLAAMVTEWTPGRSALSILLDSVVYGFYIYFVFSGYSDIAIGLARLYGYEICENFQQPFLKKNIGEFWQSWHMSLSFWCRQYIFLPTYSRSRNLVISMLATMVAIGLWHEFSVRYLLWGLYHGTGILVLRLYQRKLRPLFPQFENHNAKRLATLISIAATFAFVMIGFTIPRSASFDEIVQNFRYLIGAS